MIIFLHSFGHFNFSYLKSSFFFCLNIGTIVLCGFKIKDSFLVFPFLNYNNGHFLDLSIYGQSSTSSTITNPKVYLIFFSYLI